MATGKINTDTVKAIPVPRTGKREHLWDETLKGFGVMVTDKGVRSFLIQYRVGGRGEPTRRVTIGKLGSPWTAKTARDRAAELLEQVRRKVDPFDEQKAVVAAAKKAKEAAQADEAVGKLLAFDVIAKRYIKEGTFHKKTNKRIKTWPEYESVIVRDLKPKFKSLPLTAISADDISELLDEIGERGHSAKRMAYVVLSNIFAFAARKVKRYFKASASPMLEVENPGGIAQRDRRLSDNELRFAWSAAGGLGWPWCEIIRLLILNGQRLREVAHAPWHELNIPELTWIIPAERSKNDDPTLVPITATAKTIWDGAPRIKNEKDLVFPSAAGTEQSAFSKMKRRLDATMLALMKQEAEESGEDADAVTLKPWRLHDLRRTASVGLQRLGVSREVINALLNHKTDSTRSGISGVYMVYDYRDEKTAALEKWDARVASIVAGTAPPSNVIELVERRA